jgi:hypothetical protein
MPATSRKDTQCTKGQAKPQPKVASGQQTTENSSCKGRLPAGMLDRGMRQGSRKLLNSSLGMCLNGGLGRGEGEAVEITSGSCFTAELFCGVEGIYRTT